MARRRAMGAGTGARPQGPCVRQPHAQARPTTPSMCRWQQPGWHCLLEGFLQGSQLLEAALRQVGGPGGHLGCCPGCVTYRLQQGLANDGVHLARTMQGRSARVIMALVGALQDGTLEGELVGMQAPTSASSARSFSARPSWVALKSGPSTSAAICYGSSRLVPRRRHRRGRWRRLSASAACLPQGRATYWRPLARDEPIGLQAVASKG